MKPAILFLVFLISFPTVSTCIAGPQQKKDPPPNVLVIIADDMSVTAGIYGDKTINTPGIDKVGKEGIVFDKAFCTASSCSPSRASILTGRYPHQLKEGGNLWGTLPISYANYTTMLGQNGYAIGLTGKGWGPGNFIPGGYEQNPAGKSFESFDKFIDELTPNTPFCYWIGSHDPHRPYSQELKTRTTLNGEELKVPSWLPDNAMVHADLLDYYAEVKRFDETVAQAISLLKKKGLYDNTLIIIMSDNGMPFPRAKANVYDAGSNIPLVMRWGNHFKNGIRINKLVSLVDIAPTILDAAGVQVPTSMTGKSLLPLLTNGKNDDRFERVFLERERHANIRQNNWGYPVRAIRTSGYLYVQNLRPQRWPAGDPDVFRSVGPFGDIDNGPSKKFLMDNRNNPKYKDEVGWSLEKRPAEELYDLSKDTDQLRNLASDPAYNHIKKQLKVKLAEWRRQTADPLLNAEKDIFDSYPYYGGGNKKKKTKK